MKQRQQAIVLLMVVTGALLACKKEKEPEASPSDPIVARGSKNLPWKTNEFGNTKLAYEDTGIDACDAILNACFSCRDRVKTEEGNTRVWAYLSADCRNYRDAFKKLATDKAVMKTRCEAVMKEMKAAPDCVRASEKAEKSLKAP